MNRRPRLFCAAVLVAIVPAGTLHADRPAAKPVALREASWQDVENLVAQHRGKVVIVDIWTTTCAGCVKKFPEFVALGRKFGSQRVACISVNCDYDGVTSKPPKFYRAGVLKVLKKHNATFDNVMLNVSFLKFLESMKLESTPAVLVYAADGKLAKRFDNDKAFKEADEFSTDDVSRFVQKLLVK
jgi:thiol-disulfide isomerase/thioredoxin